MMKKILLIFLCVIAHITFASNVSDSVNFYERRLQEANENIHSLQSENEALKSEITSLGESIDSQSVLIDSLKASLSETNKNVSALADSLKINISTTRQQIQNSSDTINETIAQKSQTGIWIFIAIAIAVTLIVLVFGILMVKRKREVTSFAEKADKLNEEIVNRLSSEINDMQTISNQLTVLSTATGGDTKNEQELITTLADRITFMEMTLYKMDSSVRGHKQLSKSIVQMKNNLLANGYELVDMLGKDYHEGMKVIANFVEDEELTTGKQVITGIVKPQINYKGKMIQTAQITVSQNL